MALTQLNTLTSGNSSTASAASKATAGFTATAGRGILAAVMFRSQDVADLSAETFQATCTNSGTAVLKRAVFYDVSTRCGMAVLLVTGASGAGTVITFSLASGRLTGRQGWMVVELQTDPGTTVVVQSASTTGASPLSVALSAFANAGNFAAIFAFADGNGHLFTKEAGYTELVNTTGGSGPDSYAAEYLGSQDTTPSVTYAGGGTSCAAIGLELSTAVTDTLTPSAASDITTDVDAYTGVVLGAGDSPDSTSNAPTSTLTQTTNIDTDDENNLLELENITTVLG